MDPSSNFYNYRTALRGATQRCLTAQTSREKASTDSILTYCIKEVGYFNGHTGPIWPRHNTGACCWLLEDFLKWLTSLCGCSVTAAGDLLSMTVNVVHASGVSNHSGLLLCFLRLSFRSSACSSRTSISSMKAVSAGYPMATLILRQVSFFIT